jgi:uncharacterized protein YeaO (DUF488 family)
MTRAIHLKRAYEPAGKEDGMRILVDRLWPRGLTKAEAHLDLWLKDLAPSTKLRTWFGHRVDRWPEFRDRYLKELRGSPAVDRLLELAADQKVTLVYSARDELHNDAVVLAEHLQSLHHPKG